MDLGLNDRVYVVTGAHSGVGRACAEQLVAEGARLVISGTDERALAAVAASLGPPDRVIAVSGDLAEAGLESCLVGAAMARFERLDGALISQVPIAPGPFLGSDDGSWRLVFEESLLAPIRSVRTVAQQVSYEGGSILILGSAPVASGGDGSLSEVFLQAMATAVRGAANELGGRNVRVNYLVRGILEPDQGVGDLGMEETRRRPGERIALQRLGEPHELARTAVFLLSPAAGYITGSLVRADGGLDLTVG